MKRERDRQRVEGIERGIERIEILLGRSAMMNGACTKERKKETL